MSRYIDVNMLIKKYIDTDIKKFSNSDVKIVLENLKQNILKAPTIEPKRGEWIVDEDGNCRCSVCGVREEQFVYGLGEYWYGRGESNYCPNCGSKNAR